MRYSALFCLTTCLSAGLPVFAEERDPVAIHLGQLKSVGGEGVGNPEAAAAWKALVNLGSDALMPTLSAMDDAKPVAANWLRLAAQAIVEKEVQANRPLPTVKL